MKDFILRVTTHHHFKVTVKGVNDFNEALRRCKHWMLTLEGEIVSERCGGTVDIEVEDYGDSRDINITPYGRVNKQ